MSDPDVVVLQSSGEGPPDVQGCDGAMLLPHAAAAVPLARRALSRELRRRRTPADAVDEVAVVVSELLGNAVRHAAPIAGGDVLLRWRVTPGAVEVEVVDGGGGEVRVTPADAEATGGRGMHLVATLADSWGTSDDGHGQHAVWATVSTAPVRLAG